MTMAEMERTWKMMISKRDRQHDREQRQHGRCRLAGFLDGAGLLDAIAGRQLVHDGLAAAG